MRIGFLLVGSLFAAAWSAAAADAVPPSGTALSLFPLALEVPVAPSVVPASDGRRHLTFEVLATNLGAQPIRVEALEVRDPERDGLLLRHEADAVVAHMTSIADWRNGIDTIASGARVTVWFDLVDGSTALPARLEARIVATGDGPAASRSASLRLSPDARAPRVLHPPLQGRRWGVFEGCCDAANHHRRGQRAVDGRLRLPERYAIDFVQLDADGEANRAEGSDNADYFGFGQPVLAVADARVVDVLTDQSDRAPRLPLPAPTLPSAGGNHVILDLGDGVWAMYGHLKAGSIRVRAGETVRAGQQLGAVGNNGNSDLPHLHFQLMDTRNFALAEGLPFVFDRFRLVGDVDAASERLRSAANAEIRERQLPLTLSVVDFPPRR